MPARYPGQSQTGGGVAMTSLKKIWTSLVRSYMEYVSMISGLNIR